MRIRALFLVVAALVSCKSGRVNKRLEELRPQTDAKLAAMVAINDQLAALAPLTKDTIVYSGPKLRVSSIAYDGDTFVITAEQLATLAGKRPAEQKFPEVVWIEPWVNPLKLMHEAGDSPYWASFDQDDVDRLARPLLQLEHLVVLRTLAYVEPTDPGFGGFVPGRYSGEAHLFALDGTKYLGGFRFAAANANTVKVQYGKDDSAEKQTAQSYAWLKDDLKSQAITVLDQRLEKLSDGK